MDNKFNLHIIRNNNSPLVKQNCEIGTSAFLQIVTKTQRENDNTASINMIPITFIISTYPPLKDLCHVENHSHDIYTVDLVQPEKSAFLF